MVVKPDAVASTCAVADSTAVSEALPHAEASKSKQTTAPNFFIPNSLPHRVRVPPVGYCHVWLIKSFDYSKKTDIRTVTSGCHNSSERKEANCQIVKN